MNNEKTTQKNTKLNKKLGMRLNALLAEKGMTQKQLADILKIKPNVISYYCSGTRSPKIEEYIEIADIFQVSLDYLLCASNVKSTNPDLQAVCEYTWLSEGAVELLRKCPPSYTNTISALLENKSLLNLINLLNIYSWNSGSFMEKFDAVTKENGHDFMSSEKEMVYYKYLCEEAFDEILTAYDHRNNSEENKAKYRRLREEYEALNAKLRQETNRALKKLDNRVLDILDKERSEA